MKVAITGSSGLAKNIKDTLEETPYQGGRISVSTVRVEDIVVNGLNWFMWDKIDVLINFAHKDFEQTNILQLAHDSWKHDSSKFIINFSSRASQPNISKGHLYASQKSSLNHLSNNLTYNSDKRYKCTTLNLGLLNHQDLPSLQWSSVSGVVYYLITSYPDIEIPEMTIQAFANYQEVQSDKETFRDMEKFTK